MASLGAFALAAGILGIALSAANAAPVMPAPGDPAGLSRNGDVVLVGSRSVTTSKSTSKSSSRSKSCSNGSCTSDNDSQSNTGTSSSTSTSSSSNSNTNSN